MDFDLDESSQELQRLASGLLDREATPARLDAHDSSGEPYDQKLWTALADAGLLGACLPEDVGGADLGTVALAVVLREIAAHAAPVPAFAALTAAVTVARHGNGELRSRLGALATGDLIITAAVREQGTILSAAPEAPHTTARRDGDDYVLDGVQTFVPYAEQSE